MLHLYASGHAYISRVLDAEAVGSWDDRFHDRLANGICLSQHHTVEQNGAVGRIRGHRDRGRLGHRRLNWIRCRRGSEELVADEASHTDGYESRHRSTSARALHRSQCCRLGCGNHRSRLDSIRPPRRASKQLIGWLRRSGDALWSKSVRLQSPQNDPCDVVFRNDRACLIQVLDFAAVELSVSEQRHEHLQHCRLTPVVGDARPAGDLGSAKLDGFQLLVGARDGGAVRSHARRAVVDTAITTHDRIPVAGLQVPNLFLPASAKQSRMAIDDWLRNIRRCWVKEENSKGIVRLDAVPVLRRRREVISWQLGESTCLRPGPDQIIETISTRRHPFRTRGKPITVAGRKLAIHGDAACYLTRSAVELDALDPFLQLLGPLVVSVEFVLDLHAFAISRRIFDFNPQDAALIGAKPQADRTC